MRRENDENLFTELSQDDFSNIDIPRQKRVYIPKEQCFFESNIEKCLMNYTHY